MKICILCQEPFHGVVCPQCGSEDEKNDDLELDDDLEDDLVEGEEVKE